MFIGSQALRPDPVGGHRTVMVFADVPPAMERPAVMVLIVAVTRPDDTHWLAEVTVGASRQVPAGIVPGSLSPSLKLQVIVPPGLIEVVRAAPAVNVVPDWQPSDVMVVVNGAPGTPPSVTVGSEPVLAPVTVSVTVTPATSAAFEIVSVMVAGPTHCAGATAPQVTVTVPAAAPGAAVIAGVPPVAEAAVTVVPAGPVTVMVVAPGARFVPTGSVIVHVALFAAVGVHDFVAPAGNRFANAAVAVPVPVSAPVSVDTCVMEVVPAGTVVMNSWTVTPVHAAGSAIVTVFVPRPATAPAAHPAPVGVAAAKTPALVVIVSVSAPVVAPLNVSVSVHV
jgi:hypothetical protein